VVVIAGIEGQELAKESLDVTIATDWPREPTATLTQGRFFPVLNVHDPEILWRVGVAT
jgi:hypothetical protein